MTQGVFHVLPVSLTLGFEVSLTLGFEVIYNFESKDAIIHEKRAVYQAGIAAATLSKDWKTFRHYARAAHILEYEEDARRLMRVHKTLHNRRENIM